MPQWATMTAARERTDAEAVTALAGGDEGALDELLGRYWETAYRVALRTTGEPASAEDAAQDAFVELLRCASRFDAQRSFRPWFFRLVRNAASKRVRSRSRRVKHEGLAARPDAQPRDDSEFVVRDALSGLSPKLCETLSLHFLDGLTFSEVSETLGCPLGTVASRMRRGLETLRTRLEPAMGSIALPGLLSSLREVVPPVPASDSLIALAAAGSTPVPSAPAADAVRKGAAQGTGWSTALAALLVLAVFAAALGVLLVPVDEDPGSAFAPNGSGSGRAIGFGSPPADQDADGTSGSNGVAPVETGSTDHAAGGGAPTAVASADDGSALGGRVLTPAGQPAVGAHVFLDAWDRSEEGAVYLVTDAQGRFAVPTQESTLAVSLPGRPCQCGSPTCDCVEFFVGVVNGEVDDAPESVLYLDAAQEAPTVELRLVDLKMRGRVVDATSGQPVAGADVAWHKREEWMDRTSAKTDAQGEFVLPAMLDGYDVPNLTVTAAEGYAPVQVKVDLTQSPVVEIRLPGVRAVEGRVVDEGGRPVPDAQVRVWGDHQIRQQAGKPNSLEWVHNRLGKTDSLGRFTVGDFPDSVPVQFSVGATKDGFSEESVEVALRPGSPDVPVEIVLRSGGTFSGRVLDERGALVDGCRISEMPWGSRTKTYSDGGFSFDGLRRGTTYRFRFTAQGLQSRVVEVHPPAKLDVILRPAAAQIRVDPVDEDGKEVGSNFMVRAYAQGQVDRDVLLRHGAFVASPEALYMDEDSLDGIEALASDGDNSSGFTLDLPQGVYDLLVFRKCWSPDPRGAYRVLALPGVASGETKRVAIPEEKRVELDAQILAAEDGAPLPNYSYRLYDQTGAIVANARSNGQAALGELRLADSGTLTLEFTADGRRPEVRRVQLGAGIDTDLGEVRLARGGARVRVRFLGDSTLRPGVLVAYDDPGTGLRRGRFVDDFAGGVDFWTSPGRLTVFARAYEQDTDARRPRRITLDAVEGETREVVIDLR